MEASSWKANLHLEIEKMHHQIKILWGQRDDIEDGLKAINNPFTRKLNEKS